MVEIMLSNARNGYKRADVEQAAELIEQCLSWVPQDRISASDALNHPFISKASKNDD